MAKRATSNVSDFDVNDCVIVRDTAPRFRGYRGRVVERRTSVLFVRIAARTGRLVNATFGPLDLEIVSPCPSDWPVPAMPDLATRRVSGIHEGDCVWVRRRHHGRVVAVLSSGMYRVRVRSSIGTNRTRLETVDESELVLVRPCPIDWPV